MRSGWASFAHSIVSYGRHIRLLWIQAQPASEERRQKATDGRRPRSVCLNVKEGSGMEIGIRDSNAALGRRSMWRERERRTADCHCCMQSRPELQDLRKNHCGEGTEGIESGVESSRISAPPVESKACIVPSSGNQDVYQRQQLWSGPYAGEEERREERDLETERSPTCKCRFAAASSDGDRFCCDFPRSDQRQSSHRKKYFRKKGNKKGSRAVEA